MYRDIGTAIITVTQGDWQYIQEWIEYHHNIGIDLFLIAYNGPTEKMKDLPQYDYVKYYDYSTSNNVLFKEMSRNGKRFSGWIYENTPIYYSCFMQKVENQLFNELLYFFPMIKYCCVIDTDEFIKIKNNYQDITKFLISRLPNTNSSISIRMQFYTDNNELYNSKLPVLDRFTEKSNIYNIHDLGYTKAIINLYHEHVRNGEIKLLSPHTCSKLLPNFLLDINEIELSHYFTKSLEEWISKFNSNNDADYLNRFNINKDVFTEYFKFNKMTDEKLLIIPELLKKYNVKYDPLIEKNKDFVSQYKRVHGII